MCSSQQSARVSKKIVRFTLVAVVCLPRDRKSHNDPQRMNELVNKSRCWLAVFILNSKISTKQSLRKSSYLHFTNKESHSISNLKSASSSDIVSIHLNERSRLYSSLRPYLSIWLTGWLAGSWKSRHSVIHQKQLIVILECKRCCPSLPFNRLFIISFSRRQLHLSSTESLESRLSLGLPALVHAAPRRNHMNQDKRSVFPSCQDDSRLSLQKVERRMIKLTSSSTSWRDYLNKETRYRRLIHAAAGHPPDIIS